MTDTTFAVQEYRVGSDGLVVNQATFWKSMTVKNFGPDRVYVQTYSGDSADNHPETTGLAQPGNGFPPDVGELLNLPGGKALLNLSGSDASDSKAFVYVIGRF